MKYAIVIPDGCADEPQAALGGRTPLQAAHKPHMDLIAQTGFVGRANNVPASLTPASDVATLSTVNRETVLLTSADRLPMSRCVALEIAETDAMNAALVCWISRSAVSMAAWLSI